MADLRPTARETSALRAEIVRCGRRAESGLRACAYRPAPAAETLHRLHRDLRELRVTHRLLAPPMGNGPRDDRTDTRLRRLAGLVGEVRDRDVAIALLLRSDTGVDRTVRRRLRSQLQHEGRVGRELLRASARLELKRRLLQTVIWNAAASPLPSPVRLRREMASSLAQQYARVVRAFRRGLRNPSTRRLHRLRIALRNARALRVLVGRVSGSSADPVPSELDKLQRALGRLHDLDMVAARIAALPTRPALAPWERRWRRARKVERVQVLARMQRGRTRRALQWLVNPSKRAAGE